MSTEVNETTEVIGKKCAEVLVFNGLEIDKGIFTARIRTQIRKDDGSYIPDPENDYKLQKEQTALMMQDTFTVLNSEGVEVAISGPEVFQWIAQAMDKEFANGYPIPVIEEPVEEII